MSVPYDPIAVTGITQTAGVAEVTIASTADLYTGMIVEIQGASPDAYNGQHIIIVTSATKFTFAIATGTATPATGTIKYRRCSAPYVPMFGQPAQPNVVAYHSPALEDSAVICARGCTVTSFYGANSGADRWIMLFNAVSVPANGTKPQNLVAAGAGDNFFIDVPTEGERFTVGCVVVSSSTPDQLTITADLACHFDAQFHA